MILRCALLAILLYLAKDLCRPWSCIPPDTLPAFVLFLVWTWCFLGSAAKPGFRVRVGERVGGLLGGLILVGCVYALILWWLPQTELWVYFPAMNVRSLEMLAGVAIQHGVLGLVLAFAPSGLLREEFGKPSRALVTGSFLSLAPVALASSAWGYAWGRHLLIGAALGLGMSLGFAVARRIARRKPATLTVTRAGGRLYRLALLVLCIAACFASPRLVRGLSFLVIFAAQFAGQWSARPRGNCLREWARCAAVSLPLAFGALLVIAAFRRPLLPAWIADVLVVPSEFAVGGALLLGGALLAYWLRNRRGRAALPVVVGGWSDGHPAASNQIGEPAALSGPRSVPVDSSGARRCNKRYPRTARVGHRP